MNMNQLFDDIMSHSSLYNTIRGIQKDAAEIKTTIMDTYQSTTVRVSELKRNNRHIRSIFRWFEQHTEDTDDRSVFLDDTDDEFDAGFRFEDESSNDSPSTLLDFDNMRELMRSQNREIYKIASKQIESKLYTASEIITTINDRSSEAIASLRKIESSTLTIGKKLDLFLDGQSKIREQIRKESRAQIHSEKGFLTAGSITNFVNENSTKVAKTFSEVLMDFTGLTHLDTALNERVQSFQHNLLSKIFDIPFIKEHFRDRLEKNIDYSKYIALDFNKDAAIFDNMTRKSIVNIIPDYLKQIATFVTGKKYNVTNTGSLTTEKVDNQFAKSIDVTFNISAISDRQISDVVEYAKSVDPKLSSADAKELLRTLVSQYVYHLYSSNEATNHISPKYFELGGNHVVNERAVRLFAKAKGHDIPYWRRIVFIITSRLISNKQFRSNFAASVNKALYMLDNAAKKNVYESNKVTDTVFDNKMFYERTMARLGHSSDEFEFEGKTLRYLINKKIISKSTLSPEKLKDLDKPITTFADLNDMIEDSATESMAHLLLGQQDIKLEILTKIFERLNDGINVKFLNNKKEYKELGMRRVSQNVMKPHEEPVDEPDDEDEIIPPDPSQFQPFEQIRTTGEDEEQLAESSSVLMAESTLGSTNPSSILSALNPMKEGGIKNRIKTIFTGSMDRNAKKDKKKSLLGRVLLFGLSAIKGFVTTVLSGAKLFLNNGVTKFIGSMFKSSGEKIAGGAKSIVEGLAGSSESPGIVKRAKQNIRMKRLQNQLTEINEAPKKKTESNVDIWGGLKDTIKNSAPMQKIASFGGKLKDKIGKSEFGKGVLDAFKKQQKEKSKIKPASLSDQSTNAIDQLLSNPSPLGSIFNRFFDIMDDITEKAKDWFETYSDKQKAEEARQRREAEKQKRKANHSKMYDFGKVLGGMLSILTGIMQAVMTTIMSLKAVQKITSLLHNVLKNSLKPLNKAFQSLYKAIKPVMLTLQKVLRELVDNLSQIVISIIEGLKPLLELIGPLLEQMMEILEPILKMITDLLDVLLVPITAVMKTILVPILQSIGNSMQIITGILQVGFGAILTVLGHSLQGWGAIAKLFGAPGLYNASKKIVETGKELFTSGIDNVKSGFLKSVQLAKDNLNNLLGTNKNSETAKELTKATKQSTVDVLNGSPMDGLYGSGDDVPYKFDDNVLDALSSLKSLASGIFTMFDPDQADVETRLASESDKNAYARAQMDTADLSDEERSKIDDRAFEMFKSTINNEKLYGESDEDYRKRYEKNKAKYWAAAAAEIVTEKVKEVADGTKEKALNLINETLYGKDENGSSLTDFMESYDKSIDSGSVLEAFAKFVNAARSSHDDEYEDEYYYEGGTGDIFKAASEVFVAAKKAAGGDLHWNGTSVFNLTFDDGMVIDKISPTHCTSMMAAIVKRMGYYLPGSGYTDTYQGNDQMVATSGGHSAISWGLQSTDGHPNIFDRNGKVSEDWIMGVGNPQAGDITFGGIGGCIHGHMGAYKGADGNWFGFNGGADDSLANSVKLGEYYLSHGSFPTNTRLNPVPGKWFNDHQWTDQAGAIAPPMSYWIRYVGPKTKARRKVRKKSSSSSSNYSNIGGSNEDWIRTVAMMFEGYYYNGDKYYDNSNTHTFRIRDGRTVKARPDCSGMLGAAMTAMGYQLDYPPSSTHYNVTGMNGNLNFIHDPDGSVSKDWKLLKFTGNNLQPGDITGNKYHASFPVTNLSAAFPSGFDAGGTENIRQSAIAARAYLDGKTSIPWRSAMGSGAFSGGAGAWNIVRYVGGDSKSSNNTRRTTTSSTNKKTTSSSKKTNTKTKSNVKGKERLIRSVAEIFEAYQKTNPALTYQCSLWPNPITTRSGKTRKIRPDCSGTISAGIQELGYTLRHPDGSATGDEGLRSIELGNQSRNTLIFDSASAKSPSKDWTVLDYSQSKLQRGDILALPNTGTGKNDGHVTMPIVDLQTSPKGFDGGAGLSQSPAAAVAYLSGKTTIPWVPNSAYNRMKKIWRFTGSGDEEYIPTAFDMVETYYEDPMIEFMQDPSMFGGYGDDFIMPDLTEEIPYEEPTGPMIIPSFEETPNMQIFDDALIPQEQQAYIVNNCTFTNGLDRFAPYMGEFMNADLNVQSGTISTLAHQIADELPEYLDYFFDEDDEEYQFTEEDDMYIRELVKMYL